MKFVFLRSFRPDFPLCSKVGVPSLFILTRRPTICNPTYFARSKATRNPLRSLASMYFVVEWTRLSCVFRLDGSRPQTEEGRPLRAVLITLPTVIMIGYFY